MFFKIEFIKINPFPTNNRLITSGQKTRTITIECVAKKTQLKINFLNSEGLFLYPNFTRKTVA